MLIPDPPEFPTENIALLAWYCIACFATPAADVSDNAISEVVAIAGIVTCEIISMPELDADGAPGSIQSELPDVPCEAINVSINLTFSLSPFPKSLSQNGCGCLVSLVPFSSVVLCYLWRHLVSVVSPVQFRVTHMPR